MGLLIGSNLLGDPEIGVASGGPGLSSKLGASNTGDSALLTFYSQTAATGNLNWLDTVTVANRYMVVFESAATGSVSKLTFRLAKSGIATGQYQIAIYLATAGKEPTGALLSTTSFNTNDLSTGAAYLQTPIEHIINSFVATSGSSYCVIFRQGTSDTNVTTGSANVSDALQAKFTTDTEVTWGSDLTSQDVYFVATN